jgi:hypothetical protein
MVLKRCWHKYGLIKTPVRMDRPGRRRASWLPAGGAGDTVFIVAMIRSFR